jgi:alcohol dehydrogenase (NADP+)
LGAEHFIVAHDVAETVKEYAGSFDIILCTSFQKDMPLEQLYLKLLKPRGNMVGVLVLCDSMWVR